MLSRSIKNLTSNQLVTRTITTSSTLPRKVYQRTTTNKLNSTTLKPTSTTTTASTTSPIAKKVTKPVLTESTVIPEVKSTPNWSSADEFDHQLEFSSSSSSSNQETIVDPLPEIPSRTTRSTPAASSSVIPALTEFPNAPFPSASSINLSTPLAPLHSNHSNLARASTPLEIPVEQKEVDWTTSFHGISSQPFSREAAEKLMRPLVAAEIEIKPDGLLYLPEILYRRILNQAFGPGGWGMVPRGEMTVLKMMVSREWGLVANGRLVSVSRGEQTFFDPSGLPTATEGCKSNALMRCCKDLGIASEMWDPAFIRVFKAAHCIEAWTEHASTKKRARRWRKKGNKFEYPLVETKS